VDAAIKTWPAKNRASSIAKPTCHTLAALTWKKSAAPVAMMSGVMMSIAAVYAIFCSGL